MQSTARAILEEEDHWNKIVMHNVEQYKLEQQLHKQKIKDNQTKMKQELEQQVTLIKKQKEQEKQKEL